MCLTKQSWVRKKEGFGWKVFAQRKSNGKLYSTDCVPKGEQKKSRPVGKWITSKPCKVFVEYIVGFHIFKRRKDAKFICSKYYGHVVRKVQYREARIKGPVTWRWDWYVTPTIVADGIKILPD